MLIPRRWRLQPRQEVRKLCPGILLLPLAKLVHREHCSVSTVIFDVVRPEHDSLLFFLEMFRKLGVFEMAEVNESCEMNKPPVLLRLLSRLHLVFDSLEVPAQYIFQLDPLFVDCCLSIRRLIASSMGIGLYTKFGQVSCFGDAVHVVCLVFPRSLRFC